MILHQAAILWSAREHLGYSQQNVARKLRVRIRLYQRFEYGEWNESLLPAA